ncbi:hypothetical protein HN51_003985, partial [Arachis hypogaea]
MLLSLHPRTSSLCRHSCRVCFLCRIVAQALSAAALIAYAPFVARALFTTSLVAWAPFAATLIAYAPFAPLPFALSSSCEILVESEWMPKWLMASIINSQIIYSGYSCTQDWLFTPCSTDL